MSLGAKIGIVGLGVLALVAGALYYIFVYARNGVKDATVTGINRDAAIATNAIRDPGEPVAIDPDGTPRYGGLIEYPQRADYQIQPILNSTSVSLAGGAQNNEALPAITGNPVSLITPERGADFQFLMGTEKAKTETGATISTPTSPLLQSIQTGIAGAFVYTGSPEQQAIQEEAALRWQWSNYDADYQASVGGTFENWRAGTDEAGRVANARNKLPLAQQIQWNLRNWIGAPAVYQFGGG